MKKSLTLILTEEELLELYRIIVDRDEEGALEFVTRHLKKEAELALEGG